MTTTHTNLALVEGEVYILTDNRLKLGDYYYDALSKKIEYCDMDVLTIFDEMYPVQASTYKLEGIPQLDRKHFVKPKVDVEELAQYIYPYKKDVLSDNDKDTLKMFAGIWKAGHNAKEAEFNEQDLIDAMYSAMEYPNKRTPEETFSEFVKNYLNKLRPLSLPKSVTINENNELISVEW